MLISIHQARDKWGTKNKRTFGVCATAHSRTGAAYAQRHIAARRGELSPEGEIAEAVTKIAEAVTKRICRFGGR